MIDLAGKFVTLEGIDGAGKSSHIEWLKKRWEDRGVNVVVTREPGGTELSEAIRELVIHKPMDPLTEALLVFAARREHVQRVIKPALDAGSLVLSDRFTDSSFAYQGGGHGVSFADLYDLEFMACEDFQPDLTLWFQIDPKVAAQRMAGRSLDKFESQTEEFFTRVTRAYTERMKNDGVLRTMAVDASVPQDEVRVVLANQLSVRGW